VETWVRAAREQKPPRRYVIDALRRITARGYELPPDVLRMLKR
jgi:hypothetical protein